MQTTNDDARPIAWSEGAWSEPPVQVSEEGGDLAVTAAEGSDAWRHTAYGFVHDDAHALLALFVPGTAVEVVFTADLMAEFDQAGIMVRIDEEHWVKAGLEFADGVLGVGAVVTDRVSDWSVGAVPEWLGQRVRMRVSWSNDALTVRAGIDGEPLRLVRVAPFAQSQAAMAGPYLAAPTRAGLTVRFHQWQVTGADARIH